MAQIHLFIQVCSVETRWIPCAALNSTKVGDGDALGVDEQTMKSRFMEAANGEVVTLIWIRHRNGFRLLRKVQQTIIQSSYAAPRPVAAEV